MKNVRRICVTIVGLLLLVSCEDVSKDLSSSDNSVGMTQNNTTTNNQEELTPVILGERLNNPFSVENMQLALNSLLEKPEERYDVLVERIKENGMHEDDYSWYLDSRRYGSVPHAGFGLGFERMMMFVTGIANIRDVLPFPRTPKSVNF